MASVRPMTITEKILARAAGRDEVSPGENLPFRPDYMIAYDFPGYTDVMFRQMKDDFGMESLDEPDRYVLFIDHMLTRGTPDEEKMHDVTRSWASRTGAHLHQGRGIGHQVAAELGYALPGNFLIHFDGHISSLGAFGALGWGVRKDLLEAWITGQIYLDVPATARFDLVGELNEFVDSRDLIHWIIKVNGADGCVNQVMEYGGPGAEALSIGRRQGLCGMAMFAGGVSAIFNPDATSIAFAKSVAKRPFEPVWSDPGAVYASRTQIDLSSLEPQVVMPGSARSSNTRPVGEVAGTRLQHAYIGSCASGRIEDIRAAAEILRGKRVAEGVHLNVVPTSEQIRRQAESEGLLKILEDAGAYIGASSCDFCFGYADPLQPGENCISTGVLNISGRMGSTQANIYMGSAYTVAASALVGEIVDPREIGELANVRS